MKRYLAFVAIGSGFATVEEFLTVVLLRHDVGSYIFTLVILFPVFLSVVYFSSKLLDRAFHREQARELAHLAVYAWVGLMLEWFLMGLAPWSNPNANPLLMLVFQLGMLSFWGTVAFAPRLFLNGRGRATAKRMLRFYIPYFTLVYVIAFAAPERARFAIVIPCIIFGYLALNVFYAKYFRATFGSLTKIDEQGQEGDKTALAVQQ